MNYAVNSPMRKTFRYRIFPSHAQGTALQTVLDCCQWVYNRTLEVRRDTWNNEQKYLNLYEMHKLLTRWKKENDWLEKGHAQTMQEAQKRVDLAFHAFFRRLRTGGKPGYPRFKSSHRYDSFTYPHNKGNWRFLKNGRLRLSKIGDLKIVIHRPIEGEVKTLTIRRDSVGNWYACFSCITEPKPLPSTGKVVGIDLGLTTFATLSDGKKIRRERWMMRDKKDVARLQRKKEKLEIGGPARSKALRALQCAYQRQKNRRNNFAHQESRKLVN